MSVRKVFIKTDLTVPMVEHTLPGGHAVAKEPEIPPSSTVVYFPRGISKGSFDFGPWYGFGIDQITYAFQRQIERFLAKQDAELADMSIASYCHGAARFFLDFLVLRSAAAKRELTLRDIDRDTIDGFIASFDGEDIELSTKVGRYNGSKAVLRALCNRGMIVEIHGGDNATFPPNPFPGRGRASKGAKPLTTVERKAFSAALRQAIAPLFQSDVTVTADLLAYALLIIALHTGRNTTPLLEMGLECLRPHPKANTSFLVLFKRRGRTPSKVAVRDEESPATLHSVPTLRTTVAHLVRILIEHAKLLQELAPKEFKGRVFLYRMQTAGRGRGGVGEVTALSESTLAVAIRKLVTRYDLKDSDGKPLVINVSRLRKTFVNRVYEILDGDVAGTAAAAGNTTQVTDVSYLRPSENATANWRFLGLALTHELLTATLGQTERTPVGQCSDVYGGEYAPKNSAEICMSFLNCIRCRNYVVTGDDLYRVFSFYWRILAERSRMNAQRWQRQLAHIVRLIDRDIADAGVERGVFKQDIVDRERERARLDPHPFWRDDSVVAALAGLSENSL
ncbi:hypothetical protein JFK97_00295 [Chromobacterium phragmitis]|uniref:hypothetical protein n=1 Tax=Chromobacterium amazonense TaxID=1382803 RepID=UPI0021B7F85C|nr:hypothetical protein [Chromobacterium amazonense]MBM2882831.1 hypothetical protein [Chromobacterium amazonense]